PCALTLPGPVTRSCASSLPAKYSSLYSGMPPRSGVDTLSESPSPFPLFLKLEGKRCLVVGAGLIGLEKVESLLRCGAAIRVVAPHAVARVQELSSRGEIEWVPRGYEPQDAEGHEVTTGGARDRGV